MSNKLLWTGLTLMLAVNTTIETFGGRPSQIIVVLGALFLVIGCFLKWIDR